MDTLDPSCRIRHINNLHTPIPIENTKQSLDAQVFSSERFLKGLREANSPNASRSRDSAEFPSPSRPPPVCNLKGEKAAGYLAITQS